MNKQTTSKLLRYGAIVAVIVTITVLLKDTTVMPFRLYPLQLPPLPIIVVTLT